MKGKNMRTVIMSLACSVLLAGVIVQAEESSVQSPSPVVAKTDLKSSNEKIDGAATNNWNYF